MNSILLLVISLAAALNEVVECKPLDQANQLDLTGDDWRPFHQLLYASKGAPLEPMEQTHELLKRLKAIYKKGPADDKGVQLRLEKVSQLLDASNLNLSKCNLDNFRSLNKLIAYNQCYKLNIVPYLELHRRRQFGFCGDNFYQDLQRATGLLQADDLRQIDEDFFTSFPAVSSGQLELVGNQRQANRPQMIEQFLNFLERHTQVNNDKEAKLVSTLGLPTFSRHYNELVNWTCGPYNVKLKQQIDGLLEVGIDLFRQANQTNKWLVYAYVCRAFSNRDDLLKDTHEAYFQRYCPRGLIDRRRRR